MDINLTIRHVFKVDDSFASLLERVLPLLQAPVKPAALPDVKQSESVEQANIFDGVSPVDRVSANSAINAKNEEEDQTEEKGEAENKPTRPQIVVNDFRFPKKPVFEQPPQRWEAPQKKRKYVTYTDVSAEMAVVQRTVWDRIEKRESFFFKDILPEHIADNSHTANQLRLWLKNDPELQERLEIVVTSSGHGKGRKNTYTPFWHENGIKKYASPPKPNLSNPIRGAWRSNAVATKMFIDKYSDLQEDKPEVSLYASTHPNERKEN